MRTALIALLGAATLAAITAGSAAAGTWNIYPTITNQIGSTEPCAGHSDWGGCIWLNRVELTTSTGDWISNPYGAEGGRKSIPATCLAASSTCSYAGATPPNVDQPAFDAPDYDYGADAEFKYQMPDSNFFVVGAWDDVDVLEPQAIAGCTVLVPGSGNQYACGATYAPGTPGLDPSNSDFKSTTVFFDVDSWQDHFIAAGEVCSVPAGAANHVCAAGYGGCVDDFHYECKTPLGPGAGWGSTDPWQIMGLQFYNVDGNGPVTITDPVAKASCTAQPQQTCEIMTNGGYPGWINDGSGEIPQGASEALLVGYPGSGGSDQPPVHVEVAGVVEVPPGGNDYHLDGRDFVEYILDGFISSFDGPSPIPAGDLDVRSRKSDLRAGPARLRRHAISLSYRVRGRPARTVITVERRRGGGRWTPVRGTRVQASWDSYSRPTASGRCRFRGRTGQVLARRKHGRCHERIELDGHFHHRDKRGRNKIDITRPGGHRLPPGRYRITARAIAGPRVSRPAHAVFVVDRSPG